MIWGRAVCMAVWFMLTGKLLTATRGGHPPAVRRVDLDRRGLPGVYLAAAGRSSPGVCLPLLALCSLAAGPYLHLRGDLSGVALGELRAVGVTEPVDRLE